MQNGSKGEVETQNVSPAPIKEEPPKNLKNIIIAVMALLVVALFLEGEGDAVSVLGDVLIIALIYLYAYKKLEVQDYKTARKVLLLVGICFALVFIFVFALYFIYPSRPQYPVSLLIYIALAVLGIYGGTK